MYRVIGHPATRAFRVIWALEEIGAAYSIEPVRPHQSAITSVNPGGRVPALEVINHHQVDTAPAVIIDSTAIVQYLADSHQLLTYAAGSFERAVQDSFTHLALDEFDSVCWVLARHDFVMPESLRQKEAVLPGVQWDIDRAQTNLAARLGDNAYVMGDTFTVPDIVLGHCLGWAQRSNLSITSKPVLQYFDRLKSRDAFKRAWSIREEYQTP